jgi:hypothetical protein
VATHKQSFNSVPHIQIFKGRLPALLLSFPSNDSSRLVTTSVPNPSFGAIGVGGVLFPLVRSKNIAYYRNSCRFIFVLLLVPLARADYLIVI